MERTPDISRGDLQCLWDGTWRTATVHPESPLAMARESSQSLRTILRRYGNVMPELQAAYEHLLQERMNQLERAVEMVRACPEHRRTFEIAEALSAKNRGKFLLVLLKENEMVQSIMEEFFQKEAGISTLVRDRLRQLGMVD